MEPKSGSAARVVQEMVNAVRVSARRADSAKADAKRDAMEEGFERLERIIVIAGVANIVAWFLLLWGL
jgi:hypothetical protein